MEQDRVWAAPESLTIYEVGALEKAFLDDGGPNSDRVYDLGKTRDVDACGLQWLVAVRARLRLAGFNLVLTNVDNDLSEKMALLGLAFLTDPVAKEGAHV